MNLSHLGSFLGWGPANSHIRRTMDWRRTSLKNNITKSCKYYLVKGLSCSWEEDKWLSYSKKDWGNKFSRGKIITQTRSNWITPKSPCGKRLGRSFGDGPAQSTAVACHPIYIGLQVAYREPPDAISIFGDLCLLTRNFSSHPSWEEYFTQKKYFHPVSANSINFHKSKSSDEHSFCFFVINNMYPSELRFSLWIGSVSIWVKVRVIPQSWTLRKKGQLLLYLSAFSDF